MTTFLLLDLTLEAFVAHGALPGRVSRPVEFFSKAGEVLSGEVKSPLYRGAGLLRSVAERLLAGYAGGLRCALELRV
jgi:hypothetical protein